MAIFDVIYVFKSPNIDNNYVMENYLFNDIKDKLIYINNKKSKSDNLIDKQLFESFELMGIKFKNKFCVMNFTDNFLFDKGRIKTNEMIDFYKKLRSANIGLICMGGIYPSLSGSKQVAVINDEEITLKNYRDFTSQIHLDGTKVFLTIKSNFGRVSNVDKFIGIFPYSASFNPSYNDFGIRCARISDGKCDDLINEFVRLTSFANNAYFDGVLIDGGMDNIVGELSSEEFNNRYFGHYASVNEFVVKMITKINAYNPNFPIIYKINFQTFIYDILKHDIKKIHSLKDMRKITDYSNRLELLIKLIKCGVDGFVFEFGLKECEFVNEFDLFEDKFLYYGLYLEIKKHFENIGLKNKFNEDVVLVYKDNFDLYDKNYNLNEFDFIDVTKNVYSDLNSLNKEKTQNHCKMCIKCNICNNFAGKYGIVECLINPELNNPKPNVVLEKDKKPIAVIGAGLSGVICSLTLARRGYEVDLFEKGSIVNKNNKLNEVFEIDNYLKQYNTFLENQLNVFANNKQINIKFNTNCKFYANNFNQYKTIVIATGFNEMLPNIVGANQKHVVSIYEALQTKKVFSNIEDVSILVKSELGLKLGVYLASKNKNVSLIIGNLNFMFNIPNSNLTHYLYLIENLKIKTYLMAHIKKIHEDSVEVVVNSYLKNKSVTAVVMNSKAKQRYKFTPQIKTVDAELFVYEPNLSPNNKLYYEFVKNGFKGEIYMIGNALKIGSMYDDILSGFYVGKNI